MIHKATRSDTKEAFLSEPLCTFVDHLNLGFALALRGSLRQPNRHPFDGLVERKTRT